MKPLDFNCERKPNVLLPQIPLHTVLDSSNWSLVHFQQPRVYISNNLIFHPQSRMHCFDLFFTFVSPKFNYIAAASIPALKHDVWGARLF